MFHRDNRPKVAALLLVVLALAVPAWGQDEPKTDQERFEAMERQIEALRQELQAMKEAPAAPKADVQAPATADERLDEFERRLEILAAEIETMRLGEAAVEAVESEHGMGPAASKVYRKEQGLSIGGYGEMLYQSFASEKDDGTPGGKDDQLDFLRSIVYFGYKFDDRWLFNSEIEFEHATDSEEGEVSVEFAYLDYLYSPKLNFRVGLLLIPMGFVNELHEPTVFLGARRPDVERGIIPTTWRENGFGIFGEVGKVSYRTYLVNGFEAAGFSASGLRGGRQKGSEAKAEDFAWVGRLDYNPIPGLELGGSFYLGDSGQGIEGPTGRTLGVKTEVYEGHLEWRYRGLNLRLLGVEATLDDVAELNLALGRTGSASIGEKMTGGYLQVGYDLLSMRGASSGRELTPFVRFESFDTQDRVPAGWSRSGSTDVEILTLGLSFKPLEQLVFKLDFQDVENGADTGLDQFNVAVGYVF